MRSHLVTTPGDSGGVSANADRGEGDYNNGDIDGIKKRTIFSFA